MAGIYTRDNINYSTMLQNAIANRAKAAERQAAYIQNQGKLWGDAVANVGSTVGNAVGGYNKWKGDDTTAEAEEAELEMLKKQLEEYQKQQAEADAYHGQVQTATNLMEGYHPNVVGTYSRDYDGRLYDCKSYDICPECFKKVKQVLRINDESEGETV